MKFLIIIPAHNEEKNILYCLTSLEQQQYRNFHTVVVNDGSADGTELIIRNYIEGKPRFSLLNLPKSGHEPGAKVVKTFEKGLETQNLALFDIICKFDADIIFPTNYLAELNKVYTQNIKAGMVAGLVKVKKSVFETVLAYDFKDEKKQWVFENLSSKNHVRGPIKSYRKECLKAMDGLRPVLGWDNIDVMLAKMNGYDVITLKNLWVKHLRPTSYKYRSQKAEKLGEYFYNIGLNLPLAAISSAKSSFKNRSLKEFWITMSNFMRQKKQRELTAAEMKFIRALRWQGVFGKKN